MAKRLLAGYVLTDEHTSRDDGEITLFLSDAAGGVEWVVTVYTPAGVRGYAAAGEHGVTLLERGLIARDLTPEGVRDAVVFAAQTQRSVNWLAGFEPQETPPESVEANPRLEKLFEVEVEALGLPEGG